MSLTLRPEDVSFIEFYHWTWVTCQICSRLTTWPDRVALSDHPSLDQFVYQTFWSIWQILSTGRLRRLGRHSLFASFAWAQPKQLETHYGDGLANVRSLVHFPHVRMLASAKETWRNEKEISNPHWCSTGGHPKLPMRVSRCSRRSAMDLSVPRTSQNNSFQFLHDHRTIHCFFDMRRILIPTTHYCVCLVSIFLQ